MNHINVKTTLIILILFISCQDKNENRVIPKSLSQIYFANYSDEDKLEFIQILSAKIKKGDYKLKTKRGAFYYILGEEEKSLVDFNQVLKIDSSNSDAYLGIAVHYWHRDSTLFSQYINKTIHYNPENAFAYFLLASYRNNFENTLLDYNTAIKLEPDNAHYYFWRGEKYDFVDSVYLAHKDFKKAVELDSTLIMAYAFLGIRAECEKKYDEALKYYSLMIKFDPENDWGYEDRGNLYYEMEMYEKAIADYKNAVKHIKPIMLFKKEINLSKEQTFYYNIALNYVFINIDSTYHYLELTFDKDSSFVDYAKNEDQFKEIRNKERFKNLINKYKKE